MLGRTGDYPTEPVSEVWSVTMKVLLIVALLVVPLFAQVAMPSGDDIGKLMIDHEKSQRVQILSSSADDLEVKIRKIHEMPAMSKLGPVQFLSLIEAGGLAALHSGNPAQLYVYRWRPEGTSRVRFSVSLNQLRRVDNAWRNLSLDREIAPKDREILLLLKVYIESN